MGLPKIYRLRQRQDFTKVYNEGLRRSTDRMTLRALRPTDTCYVEGIATNLPTQIGVVVSLKVSKRAVIRNRIRRRIQAAMLQLWPNLAPAWKLVIIARPGLTECNYAEILQQLEQLLTEVKVLHGNS